ncbi:MAG: response regulator transcription factor [Gammaproteobacteria bacterium]|nr:response regulator transcription factor [Gammaproteobacteria bacterium]
MPILVVDDDVRVLRFAREALARAGYYPVVTGEHREISRIVRTEKPGLVLLDLMLPDTDGIELMRTVPELADLPVIFISAYGRDETIAKALERGAVDYLVKPFSATELTARIRAALRAHAEPETFTLGDLQVRYAQRRVTLAGEELSLTAGEYELLRILSVSAGRCVNYDALIRQMWQEPGAGDPDRVRTFVKQLRRKLGDDPARPRYILNERGVGYRMAAP